MVSYGGGKYRAKFSMGRGPFLLTKIICKLVTEFMWAIVDIL